MAALRSPRTCNAAPAEYVGWAALCIKLGPEIPQRRYASKGRARFDDRYSECGPRGFALAGFAIGEC